MATYITPSVIASSALATLYNTMVLASLISRDYDSDFAGKVGDTITVRTPAIFTVDEFDRAQGIQLQDPTEGSFTVTLDTIPDVSFPVTTEELTLELDQFESRLLNPAMEAIAQYFDGKLAEAVVDAANDSAGASATNPAGGGVLSATGSTPGRTALLKARTAMSRAKAPMSDRYAVLSPEGSGEVLDDDFLQGINTSGSPVALRDGAIGRLYGIENYESQVFGYGPDDKGQADGAAFHRSAVALVTRQLQTPMGLPSGQVSMQNYKGIGLRVLRDWDTDKKQDVISVDTLYGVKVVRRHLAFELDFGAGS